MKTFGYYPSSAVLQMKSDRTDITVKLNENIKLAIMQNVVEYWSLERLLQSRLNLTEIC